MHIYPYISVSIRTSICVYPCLPVSTRVYPCLPVSTRVYPCLSVSICVYPCLFVSICLCLPVPVCRGWGVHGRPVYIMCRRIIFPDPVVISPMFEIIPSNNLNYYGILGVGGKSQKISKQKYM